MSLQEKPHALVSDYIIQKLLEKEKENSQSSQYPEGPTYFKTRSRNAVKSDGGVSIPRRAYLL